MCIGKNENPGLAAIAILGALMLSASAFAVETVVLVDPPATAIPAGLKVVRDSVTGQLRAPTSAEAQAMANQDMAAMKASAKTAVGMVTGTIAPEQTVTSNGAVMLELTEDTMVYSVVQRAADGSMSMQCVTGSDAAKKLINSKSPATKQEHKHDK